LFIGQAGTPDPRQRANIVRDFERRAITVANVVPIPCGTASLSNRPGFKGWAITSSHYLNQDLADVWLGADTLRSQ
jgi:hypothetical protein